MMSGHGSIETAVKAIKLGAYDYIEKPLSLENVTLRVKHALAQYRLEQENRSLKTKVQRPLEGLKVGPFYGCYVLRPKIAAVHVAGVTEISAG